MLVYLAHPVRPVNGRSVRANLRLCKDWLEWAMLAFPEHCFVMPYIPTCEVLDDSNPDHRAIGRRSSDAVLARCDELWALGDTMTEGVDDEACQMAGSGRPVRRILAAAPPVDPDRDLAPRVTWTAGDYADAEMRREARKPKQLAGRPAVEESK